MNVCLLINQLAPGGAPTLLLDIVRHTDPEANIDYTVCFIEGEDELASDFEAAGARVVDFRAAFKFDPRAMWRMFWFFQREEFDVLHAHLPYSQTLGRVFGRFGGIEGIVSTQHDFQDKYHPITRTLERLTRPLDKMTVAVSQSVERDFIGESHQYPDHNGKWCTIYNGVDVGGFAERVKRADGNQVREEYGIGNGPLFLSVGRYVASKNQSLLIEAIEDVVATLPNAELLLVGWGPLRDELKTLVSERGLNEHVTIAGRSTSVEKFYAAADAFALSSHSESFGIVLVEAMASRLPVVARDVPGPNEIVVDTETGILVEETESSRRFSKAMVAVATNDNGYGEAGFKRAESCFSADRAASQYSDVYDNLVASPGFDVP